MLFAIVSADPPLCIVFWCAPSLPDTIIFQHVYFLCRPREDHSSPSYLPASPSCGWVADGLQLLALDRGSDADAWVRSLNSRLATAVDTADILAVAGLPRASPLSPCPVLLLIDFFNGILEIVGDCEDGCQQGLGRPDLSGTAAAGVSGDVGFPVGAQGAAVLRSALATLAEFLLGPQTIARDESLEHGRPTPDVGGRSLLERVAHDDFSRLATGFPGGNNRGKSIESLLFSGEEGDAAVWPIPQLVTLRFLHQAILRWPRLTVKFMQEIDLWDLLLSERFLSGGSSHITRAFEGLRETEAAAGSSTTTPTRSPDSPSGFVGDGGVSDFAVGWGMAHDGVLLLLEAVVVVRCFLHLGPEELVRGQEGKAGGRTVRDQGSRAARSLEIEQYVRFLSRGGSSGPCAIVAMQGCRWLRAVAMMESAVGIGLLVPPSLRVSTLCLAFQLCDRGHGAGSDARTSATALWPLVHASLSLAVALVRSSSNNNVKDNEGVLFQSAVEYALDADLAAGAMATATAAAPAPAPAKSRAHHLTASMTSDVSSPGGAHAPNAWWTPGSGGSRTPVSVNSVSPRAGPSFSFGDTHTPPTPKPPRPLPEMLFKAALDPRVRRAVFFLAVMLGVEAGRGAVASLDVHARQRIRGGGVPDVGAEEESLGVQETATAMVSGVVEGFLCLCERAAVATVSGSAATGDGTGLLLDALRGACGLVRSGAPQRIVSIGSGGRTSSSGAGHGGLGGARIGSSPGKVGMGDAGVSPLLQEAFREHWASARLLIVLESVVGTPGVSRSAPNSPAVTMETCSDIVTASLSLFTAMMSSNSLGKRAFRRALSEHYDGKNIASSLTPSSSGGTSGALVNGGAVRERSSFLSLADLASVVPPASLCRTLMEMLMDGANPVCVIEAQAEGGGENANLDGAHTPSATGSNGGLDGGEASPPEIRNPFVVPLIFRMLLDWPFSEQERIMKAFRSLLTGAGAGLVNRSLCCDVQPALMDQVMNASGSPSCCACFEAVVCQCWRLWWSCRALLKPTQPHVLTRSGGLMTQC